MKQTKGRAMFSVINDQNFLGGLDYFLLCMLPILYIIYSNTYDYYIIYSNI